VGTHRHYNLHFQKKKKKKNKSRVDYFNKSGVPSGGIINTIGINEIDLIIFKHKKKI